MPIALGIAIFLSNYAPARAVKPLGFLVDMLAAVPSIVYGLWGWQVLGPKLSGFYTWLESWAGGFFLFKVYDNSPSFETGRNIFTGGIVLAVMILPIMTVPACSGSSARLRWTFCPRIRLHAWENAQGAAGVRR